jgi:digeranylgeranylglycerophospholipid reductase
VAGPVAGADERRHHPRGASLGPRRLYRREHSVVRVGDAAGIATCVTGNGTSQAVESSYLAAELAAEGRLREYPDRVYRRLKPEFLFASAVQQLIGSRRPRVLGAAIRAASGVGIEAVDRSPATVLRRLARHPIVFASPFARPGVLRRVCAGVTDRWHTVEKERD